MPARDSNASFLFLMVLITGVALAAPSEAATVRLLTARVSAHPMPSTKLRRAGAPRLGSTPLLNE